MPDKHSDQQSVDVVKLAPYLDGRTPAADTSDHKLAPAANDLILVVAQVGGHLSLAAASFHECTFLYIWLAGYSVPPNSTAGREMRSRVPSRR